MDNCEDIFVLMYITFVVWMEQVISYNVAGIQKLLAFVPDPTHHGTLGIVY